MKYYGSIELMRSFLTFTPSYNDKKAHFTGGPNFLLEGPGPFGPLAGYVPVESAWTPHTLVLILPRKSRILVI